MSEITSLEPAGRAAGAAAQYRHAPARAQTCERIAGRELRWSYDERARAGDHIWWVSDNGRFQRHYPSWKLTHDVPSILKEIHDANAERWLDAAPAAAAG